MVSFLPAFRAPLINLVLVIFFQDLGNQSVARPKPLTVTRIQIHASFPKVGHYSAWSISRAHLFVHFVILQKPRERLYILLLKQFYTEALVKIAPFVLELCCNKFITKRERKSLVTTEQTLRCENMSWLTSAIEKGAVTVDSRSQEWWFHSFAWSRWLSATMPERKSPSIEPNLSRGSVLDFMWNSIISTVQEYKLLRGCCTGYVSVASAAWWIEWIFGVSGLSDWCFQRMCHA